MKLLRIAITSILCLPPFLTACSSQSSTNEVTKELQTVNSWAATAYMVGQAWTHGTVPTPYAQTTLKKAQKELHKEADTLAKKTSGTQQAKLREHLQNLDQMLSQMSIAVEQQDHYAIASQLQQLLTEEKAISALAKITGEKS